MKSEIKGT